MYTSFYKLTARPFQLSPDHRFFFASRGHNRALAYLTFGLNERDGFIVITGDIGAGKTTLVGHLLSQIDRERFVVAKIVTTQLQADDALRLVASAFDLPYQAADKATLLRTIERFLMDSRRQGKHVLLVVDESQNLSMSALEELRMLSNFQIDNAPLFQCFLLGQPQFRRTMASEQLDQLRQRVIASCHLEPLAEDETRAYVEHRLTMVGWNGDPSFDDSCFPLIHRFTGGVPRRINTLCSRVLLYGSLEEQHRVDPAMLEDVVHELAEEGTQPLPRDSNGLGGPDSMPFSPRPALDDAGYGQILADLDRRVAQLKSGD